MLISSNCADIGTPNIQISKFPDGENYVRLLSVSDLVLHRCYPDPNSSLFQLFQIIDVLKEAGISARIIIPYLIYSRQERRTFEGEAISTNTIFNMFSSLGVREVITFNCHFIKRGEYSNLAGVKIHNISLANDIISKAKQIAGENTLIVAPDEGAIGLGAQTFFVKRRGDYVNEKDTTFRQISSLDDTNIRAVYQSNKYENVILIDDIIASGGTMLSAAKRCKEIGFKKVIIACIHAQLLNDSEKKLLNIADDIVSTNTIRNKYEKVDFFNVLKKRGIV